ncbi:hypothetical protein D3C86_1831500 [compost metagenome]
MEIVDVQDVQFIIGEGCARGEGKNGRGHQAGPHVSDHDVLLFCRLSPDRIRSAETDPVPTVGVALPGRMFSSLEGDFKR